MKRYNLILFGIIVILMGCGLWTDKWHGIKVVNNSSRTLQVSTGTILRGMFSYPDTLLPINKPSLTIVRPNSFNFMNSAIKWEDVIKEDNKSDSLSIYIFDTDTLTKYDWESIRVGYKVLKRYDFSIEDLKRKNWIVTYP